MVTRSGSAHRPIEPSHEHEKASNEILDDNLLHAAAVEIHRTEVLVSRSKGVTRLNSRQTASAELNTSSLGR